MSKTNHVLEALKQGSMKASLLVLKPYLTFREVALLYGCSVSYLRKELSGKIPVHYLTGPNTRTTRSQKLFARKDVEAWIAANEAPALDVRRHLGEFINGLTKRRK